MEACIDRESSVQVRPKTPQTQLRLPVGACGAIILRACMVPSKAGINAKGVTRKTPVVSLQALLAMACFRIYFHTIKVFYVEENDGL